MIKHPVTTSYLEVGYVGSLSIRVPITTIGDGKPHMCILCGVHGDETTSLIIARQFVEELKNIDSLAGSVSIITAANPFAQATRTRVTISDYFDLNRHGRGKPDGTLTERLAYALYEFLSKCSFVIDLHEFVMKTPMMAIYIPSSQDEIDRHILQGIAAFNPTLVWAMNLTAEQETKYSGSLLATLIKQGIPGFAVEASRLPEITSAVIQVAAEGLIEVAKFINIIDGQCRVSIPRTFIRKPMYSSQAGIWTPKSVLLNPIKEGEIIGEITSLNLTENISVLSHIEGTLIQLASADLIDTGSSLFTIGVEDPDLSAKFVRLHKKFNT